MARFHAICVGKLKDNGLQSIESDYLKRLKSLSLQIHELKGKGEDLDQEAAVVLKKILDISKGKKFKIMTLEERGREFDSNQFASFVDKLNQDQDSVFFVFGGSAGHGRQILEQKSDSISLGKMTYPHQLARILFVEQFYRAQTIIEGHPYSK